MKGGAGQVHRSPDRPKDREKDRDVQRDRDRGKDRDIDRCAPQGLQGTKGAAIPGF
jgi:hypothetical protein